MKKLIVISILLMLITMSFAQTWTARVTSINGYSEPNEDLCDVIDSGFASISPDLVETDYYWTNYIAKLDAPVAIPTHFAIEFRLKNNSSTNGIVAYDTGIYLEDAHGNIAGGIFMGVPSAYIFASVHIGNTSADSLQELVVNMDDWVVYRMELSPGEMKLYCNSILLYTLNHNENFCGLKSFSFHQKGTGIADYVRMYDTVSGSLLFSEDFNSCNVFVPLNLPPLITGVINHYAAVTDICCDRLTVDNISGFQSGEDILLIAMKGAIINTSNTDSFGVVTAIGNAGKYERNTILAIEGNDIIFKYRFINNFLLSDKVQMVNIPDLDDAFVCDLSCDPWDGNKGGILIFKGGSINMAGNIDVSGKGYRGGAYSNEASSGCPPLEDYYFAGQDIEYGGLKGESFVDVVHDFTRGKGSVATAGGGGNQHNAGGGGGSNILSTGGKGGHFINPDCNLGIEGTRGLGGTSLLNAPSDRLLMGGGGGAGHSNNETGTSGGAGGGIVIILAESISCNEFTIISDGEDAESSPFFPNWGDGAGGGGGGGSVMIQLNSINNENIIIDVKGGIGGSCKDLHGGGGGGGGGMAIINTPTGGINLTATGGINGLDFAGNSNGASSGSNGQLIIGTLSPASSEVNEPFKVSSYDIEYTCAGTASMTILTQGGCAPSYSFSVNSSSVSANPVFNGLTDGQYTIQAQNGCATFDTLLILDVPETVITDVMGLAPQSCHQLGEMSLSTDGGVPPYYYVTAGFAPQNEGFFTDLLSGVYQTVVYDSRGCSDTLDVQIADSTNMISIYGETDTIVETGSYIQLIPQIQSTFDLPLIYHWSPSDGLSCTDCLTPVCSIYSPMIYTLEVEDPYGCTAQWKVAVDVRYPPVFFPNVFYPDSPDFLNRYFYPGARSDVQVTLDKLLIFDRWGNLVFEKSDMKPNDIGEGWDGTFRGKELPAQVFIWIAEIRFLDNGVQKLSGDITLLR